MRKWKKIISDMNTNKWQRGKEEGKWHDCENNKENDGDVWTLYSCAERTATPLLILQTFRHFPSYFPHAVCVTEFFVVPKKRIFLLWIRYNNRYLLLKSVCSSRVLSLERVRLYGIIFCSASTRTDDSLTND